MGPLRRLFGYVDRYRRAFALGLACTIATQALALASPKILQHAIDDLTRSVTRAKLLLYGSLLLGIGVVGGVFRFLMRRLLIGASRSIEYDMRNDFYAHLEKLPAEYFQRHRTGDLMSRATNDLNAVRMMIGPSIMYASNTMLTFVVALILMIAIDPRLTLFALIPMPFVSVTVKLFGGAIHRRFEQIQAQLSDISAVVQEALAGVRVVRAYRQEEAELDRFRASNEEYMRRNRRLIALQGFFFPMMSLFLGLGAMVVLWLGSAEVIRGRITVGEFVAFNVYLTMLTWPMIAFGWVTNMVQRGMASWKRMLEVLETVPSIRDPGTEVRLKADTTYGKEPVAAYGRESVVASGRESLAASGFSRTKGHDADGEVVASGFSRTKGHDADEVVASGFSRTKGHDADGEVVASGFGRTKGHDADGEVVASGFSRTMPIRGEIEFRNLTFAYASSGSEPPRPVLQDVSAHIPAGQTVALVGPTGSGKSTLIALLARLYDPPPGTVFIDGVDVRELPFSILRRAIGFVPQEPFLFSDTLADNIAFGLDAQQAWPGPPQREANVPAAAGDRRRELILAAAAVARVDKDVVDFPKGYDTMVGERGITLSGGQKQRTAIARAVAIDPRILILDDALSAVDTYTEDEILSRLVGVMRDRTSVIVSHRISTVRRADTIIVLQEGRIVERGTHDELVRQKGLYAELHTKQLLEEELAAS